jgi:hypothetical protein
MSLLRARITGQKLMPYATEAWDKPGIQRSIKRPIVGAPCPIPQRLGTNQESNVPFNACLVGKPCPTPSDAWTTHKTFSI